MIQTLYIMCGVGFSGKSTLAKKIAEYKNATLVSQDAIYFEKEKEWNLKEESDEDWGKVLAVSKERIIKNLLDGKSVVFDYVNVAHNEREQLKNLASGFKAEAVVIFLDTSIEVQRERQVRNRETQERHQVKQEWLDEAIKNLEIPLESEHAFIFTPETDLTDWLNKLP